MAEKELKPCGYKIKVLLDPVDKFAEGSTIIEKPVSALEKEKFARHVGTVVELGEFAFYDMKADWVKVGDRVMFAQYAGQYYEEGDSEYRFINDKDLMGYSR